MVSLDAVSRRHFGAALGVMIAAYAATFSILGALQYRFYTAAFDLPIFAQAMEGMLHGRFHGSIRGMNFLGDHSSLILFLLVPVYALFRHPLTLVVVQSLALALGAIPVARLARRSLGRADRALACAALYLMYPALGYSNLFEFHPEVLCTSALLAAFDAIEEDHRPRALAFSALALLGKEDVAFVVLGMAAWACLARRRRALPLAGALALLSVGSLALSFGILKPRLNAGEANYLKMYAEWGRTPREILIHLARHPLDGVRAWFDSPSSATDTALKRGYWIYMLAPLLALPILAPATLAIALPIVTEHFLSNRGPQHTIICQYTALVTPFMIAAAVLGLRRLTRSGTRSTTDAILIAALLASVAANLVFGPVLGVWRERLMPNYEPVGPTASDVQLAPWRDALVRRAGHPTDVVAGFEFLERFLRSPRVHTLHHLVLGRYTYSERLYPVPDHITVLIAALDNPYLMNCVEPASGARMRDLIVRNRLVPVDAAGDNVLFLRGAADSIELIRHGARSPQVSRRVEWDHAFEYLGWDPPAPVRAGSLLPIRTYWRRIGRADAVYSSEVLLSDARDSARVDRKRMIGYLYAPISDWPLRDRVRETYRLPIPPGLEPGRYVLGIRIERQVGESEAAARPDDPEVVDNDSTLVVGRIRVTARRPTTGRAP